MIHLRTACLRVLLFGTVYQSSPVEGSVGRGSSWSMMFFVSGFSRRNRDPVPGEGLVGGGSIRA